MDRTAFRRGLATLIIVPLLVLSALAAFVWVSNAMPQSGAVAYAVKPAVTFVGRQSVYEISVDGVTEEDAQPEPPIDMVFLIDVSGSMSSSLGAMAEAARSVTGDLSHNRPDTQFALVGFDSKAETLTDWTLDPSMLYQGLQALKPYTGENDTRAAFAELDGLLARARPNSRKVVVFYTDGGLEFCNLAVCGLRGPMTQAEMVVAAQALRDKRVDIYAVGLPGHSSDSLMRQITGASNRVIDPTDTRDLLASFRLLTNDVVGFDGEGASLVHLLDGRHFAAPIGGTAWGVDRNGNLVRHIGALPKAPMVFRHAVVPLSAGLWKVGLEPPALVFADSEGQVQRIAGKRRPQMLVLDWLLLLLAFLPALLWALAFLLFRRPVRSDPPELAPLPPVLLPRRPNRLPEVPTAGGQRPAPIPTLFVGLGGTGIRALHAVRADLKEAHLGQSELPYQFVGFDLATEDPAGRETFDSWPEMPIQVHAAPAEVRRAESYVPSPVQLSTDPRLQWFDAQRYIDARRDQLNLTTGSDGDRALSRLALFQWLGNEVSATASSGTVEPGPRGALQSAIDRLLAADSIDDSRQVVVLASRDGGVGSGWVQDIGRLVQRMGRQCQRAGTASLVPEVVAILIGPPLAADADPEDSGNRDVLDIELSSAMQTGSHPRLVAYLAGDPLLDARDGESPFHYLFAVAGSAQADGPAQVGDISTVLVEREARRAVLTHYRDALIEAESPVVPVAAKSAHVMPSRLRSEVRLDLLLRIFGPDILLDIEAAPSGGYAAMPVAEAQAVADLAQWAAVEPNGSPWQLIVAAAAHGADGGRLAAALGGIDRAWIEPAFATATTNRLHGKRAHENGQWVREDGGRPSRMAASLGLLAGRLRDQVIPASQAAGAPGSAVDALRHAADMADTSAGALSDWIRSLAAVCEREAVAQAEARAKWSKTARLADRIQVDVEEKPAEVARLAQQCLTRWLGGRDTVGLLREHLYFSVDVDSGVASIKLNACFNEVLALTSPEAAAEVILRQAQALAELAPAGGIGSALAAIAGAPEPTANAVTGSPSRWRAATGEIWCAVTTPDDAALGGLEAQSAAAAIDAFAEAVPRPPNHRRERVTGDNPSAICRIALSRPFPLAAPKGSTRFIDLGEQAAERLRQRLERMYEMTVPIFPTPLRTALAHPAAFRSFGRAFKAGHIVQAMDDWGRMQWYFSSQGRYLTFGDHTSLADAAANYAWTVEDPPSRFEARSPAGDVADFERWTREGGHPGADTLVVAAISAIESEE